VKRRLVQANNKDNKINPRSQKEIKEDAGKKMKQP
jgi:hypothetical protein